MIWQLLLIILVIALILGGLLALAAYKFKLSEDPKVAQIEALLPQTQCAQCGYPGCKPYAQAIAKGEADINLCPPGGQETVIALADLLHLEVKPLEKEEKTVATVAYIHEDKCIGCVLCIKACPVDAIIGAPKQMHTIISSECTGCDLCVPACPVDCIEMIPAYTPLIQWNWDKPQKL